ncbi:MAG: hypothetical protein KBD37_03955 [Burkholderiales bacterium]|nr:hypothetical protein [Burkholderiales bacterium]
MNDAYAYDWENVFNLMKISIQNFECLAQFSIKSSRLAATETRTLIDELTNSINSRNPWGVAFHTIINNTEKTIHNYQELCEKIGELNSQACHESEHHMHNFERSLKSLAAHPKK